MEPQMIVIDPTGPLVILMLSGVLGVLLYLLERQMAFCRQYTLYKTYKEITMDLSREGREWFNLLNVPATVKRLGEVKKLIEEMKMKVSDRKSDNDL